MIAHHHPSGTGAARPPLPVRAAGADASPRGPSRPVSPGPGLPVLETARLVLRPLALGDADAIAAALGSLSIARMMPSLPFPFDRQDALEWLLPRVSGVTEGWTLAITLKGDAALQGAVSIEQRNARWEFGYWLAEPQRGKGLMKEAARAVLEAFFGDHPDAVLHASVLVDNPASFAVQAALGFRVSGCRDVYCPARGGMRNALTMVIERSDLA